MRIGRLTILRTRHLDAVLRDRAAARQQLAHEQQETWYYRTLLHETRREVVNLIQDKGRLTEALEDHSRQTTIKDQEYEILYDAVDKTLFSRNSCWVDASRIISVFEKVRKP